MLKAITLFDQYLKSQGIPIAGVSGKGKDAYIDFLPEATKEQQMFALEARKDFNWEDQKSPEIKKFKESVFATLPDAGKLQLAPILMSLSLEFIADPTNMQIYWLALLASRPPWLTNEVVAQIDQIALDCNIPIKRLEKNEKMA